MRAVYYGIVVRDREWRHRSVDIDLRMTDCNKKFVHMEKLSVLHSQDPCTNKSFVTFNQKLEEESQPVAVISFSRAHAKHLQGLV